MNTVQWQNWPWLVTLRPEPSNPLKITLSSDKAINAHWKNTIKFKIKIRPT
jgi:hypothetical protein